MILISASYSCSPTNSPKKNNFKGVAKKTDRNAPTWANTIKQEILKLGNFNWIIIAEPTFSNFKPKGITTLTIDASSPEVIKQVFNIIERNGHVDGKIYFSKESRFLTEKQTPGITQFKTKRDKALSGRKTRALNHAALEILLIEAKQKHRILIIKTNTLLPYSSVFIELESGYWHSESETALRKPMIR